LQLSSFGSPDEVLGQAKPLRSATTRREASEILKMIAQQGPLTSKSGLTAHLTSKTIGKIVSSDALNKSFGVAAHYQAAVNLDRLFPMEYEENIVIVKFTVKEYLNPDNRNNLYSIEALDIIPGQKKQDAWYN
jgi:hypothetical protein